MLNDFLVRIIACFIPNTQKRRAWRARHLTSAKMQRIETIADEIARRAYINKLNLAAACLHSDTFAKYKNCFAGQDVVLIAGGASVRDFNPIKGAIYVGVNRAYKFDKVKLDYLFVCDWRGFTDIEDIMKLPYKPVKFYGILPPDMSRIDGRSILIPESVAIRHGASRFYIKDNADRNVPVDELNITYDISAFPLTCFSSVVSPAMQFILYGNPRRIYLVGCDCNSEPHFYNNKKSQLYLPGIMEGWYKIRDFARDYYPETEIISVNPVGLRGVFKDLYQKKDER